MTRPSATGIVTQPAGRRDGRAVLEARAAALARSSEEEEVERVALLTFLAGQRSYAVAATSVERVVDRPDISRLPWAPPAVVGVANVAGDVLPVVDVERLLRVGTCRVDGPILVVEHDGDRFGLLAEAISDFLAVPLESLVAPAAELTATAGLVVALTGATLVLDVAALRTATAGHPDSRRTDEPNHR